MKTIDSIENVKTLSDIEYHHHELNSGEVLDAAPAGSINNKLPTFKAGGI